MIETSPVIIAKQAPLLEFVKKQQENRRFNNALEISATLIIISFFAFFAIKPAITTISALLGEIKSKQLMVENMKGKINNIVAAQDSFAQVQERYQVIESALPASPRFSHATIQLHGSAAEAGYNLNNVTYELHDNNAKTPNIYLSSYNMGLNTITGFQGALKILDTITQNRRLINIKTVSLIKPKESNDSFKQTLPGQVLLTVGTETYYWKSDPNEKK